MSKWNDLVVPDGKKIVATFTTWMNSKVEYEIKKEYIQDIVDAVEGQYTYYNNVQGFGIKGGQFKWVDIWLADNGYELIKEVE